jgi:hypothetical protein
MRHYSIRTNWMPPQEPKPKYTGVKLTDKQGDLLIKSCEDMQETLLNLMKVSQLDQNSYDILHLCRCKLKYLFLPKK